MPFPGEVSQQGWGGLRIVDRGPSHLTVADTVGASGGPHLQSPGRAAPVACGALTCLGESFTKLRTLDFVEGMVTWGAVGGL